MSYIRDFSQKVSPSQWFNWRFKVRRSSPIRQAVKLDKEPVYNLNYRPTYTLVQDIWMYQLTRFGVDSSHVVLKRLRQKRPKKTDAEYSRVYR